MRRPFINTNWTCKSCSFGFQRLRFIEQRFRRRNIKNLLSFPPNVSCFVVTAPVAFWFRAARISPRCCGVSLFHSLSGKRFVEADTFSTGLTSTDFTTSLRRFNWAENFIQQINPSAVFQLVNRPPLCFFKSRWNVVNPDFGVCSSMTLSNQSTNQTNRQRIWAQQQLTSSSLSTRCCVKCKC